MHGALACMHMRHMRVCTSACVFAHACLHIRASLSIAFCISPADSFCSFRFAHSVNIFLSCLFCRPNTFSTFPFPIPLSVNFCVKARCRQGRAQCAALEGRALPGRGLGHAIPFRPQSRMYHFALRDGCTISPSGTDVPFRPHAI